MDKVSKMNMFCRIADAVNTRTSVSPPTPLAVTASAPTLSPTSAVGASTYVLYVDHLLGATTILPLEEPTSFRL